MEKWFLRNKKGDASALADALSVSPVVARILVNRGVDTVEKAERYLHGDLNTLHSPYLLKDCEKAAQILRDKIQSGRRIRIIGDYDCDGICATYILRKVLTELKANADYCLPHRIKDGYGLNIAMVEEAVRDGVDTILTCDNGIAAIEQIAYAKEQGLTVIITDHHEVPFEESEGAKHYILPKADAIVNMKQADDGYPFKGICGAVTAWKLGQVLLGEKHPVILELIPYAALATVCDIMDLMDENRILVKEGLRILNTCPPEGLKALIKAYELEDKQISAYHMGFLFGPCLNATGRLETAEYALKLLDMTDAEEAFAYACELKSLNEVRKSLTIENTEKALEQLRTSGRDKDPVIVMYLPDCHESLAGIIAGRIRETCHRPCLVFTRAEDGVKASGRSMECYDMFKELSACRDLFTKFGGHKMAAGLSMDSEDKIEVLRHRLHSQCTLKDEDFIEKIYIDAAMPMSMADLELARELEQLEPFGTGNTKPVFAEKDLTLITGQRMGLKGNAARYTVKSQDGRRHQVLYFGELEEFHKALEEKFGSGISDKLYRFNNAFPVHMTYTVQINTYMQRESLQIMVKCIS